MRICVIGDELVAGVGDPRGLGWVGRAVARTDFLDPPTVVTLAMPGENTGELATRWEAEVTPRIDATTTTRLIIAIGTADTAAGISIPRARLSVANIVDRAATLKLTPLVVGPPPLAGADRSHLEALSRACQEVCERRHVIYVDTIHPLHAHDQWLEDMAASQARTESGAVLPGQAGYALLAWLVLHQGWYQWLGAEPRE